METIQLYFYASRQIAQDISCSRFLRAGPSGYIYLTPVTCTSGTEAAASLSIHGHPVEFRCRINAPRQFLEGPVPAHALFSLDGLLLRPGGGAEYRFSNPVLFLDSPPEWRNLDWP